MDAIQYEVFQGMSISWELSLHRFATVVDAEMCVSVLRVNLCEIEVSLGQVLFKRATTATLPLFNLRW